MNPNPQNATLQNTNGQQGQGSGTDWRADWYRGGGKAIGKMAKAVSTIGKSMIAQQQVQQQAQQQTQAASKSKDASVHFSTANDASPSTVAASAADASKSNDQSSSGVYFGAEDISTLNELDDLAKAMDRVDW